MKVGIIGKASCGKSTVFNALSGANVSLYEKKADNIAVIKVPDERLDFLYDVWQPRKKTPAEICFVDIGADFADKGVDSFAPRVVARMREPDALVVVVDAFSEGASPAREVKKVIEELMFLDLVPIEDKLERNKKEHIKSREIDVVTEAGKRLEAGEMLKNCAFKPDELFAVKGYRFLTQKPVLVALNVSEDDLEGDPDQDFLDYCRQQKLEWMKISGKLEMEMLELELVERNDFLEDLGVKELARDAFIKRAYDLLDVITFFTMGEKEVHAWTIERGTSAHRAAGKIHTDIERGFIRAEVIKYDDFTSLPDEKKIKEAGKCHLEGKEYIVEDGDIILFRFNV